MAKFLAYFTGLILSLMVSLNGLLSASTNAFMSNFIYHLIGMVFFVAAYGLLYKKLPKSKFRWIYLLPGVLGSMTVLMNNIVINVIGVTLMVAFSLIGQVVTSITIDQFGLLGKPPAKSSFKQWLGVLVMVIGLIIMI